MIKKAVLAGLVIHDVDDPTVPYSVNVDGLKGLAEPTYRISAYESAGEDGGHVAAAYLGMRPVAIAGLVRGLSDQAFSDNRRALQRTGAIQKEYTGRPILQTLTVTTLNDETYTVDGIIRRVIIGVAKNNYAEFLIEMLCPDPYLSGTDLLTSGQVTRGISTGVNFPWVFDPTIEFGETTGGDIVIDNEGTTDSWPIITLRGEMTDPILTHNGSFRMIQLETTLNAADVVVIDMKKKTVVLNGTTNYLYTRTLVSNWFSINPGINYISFDTASASDTGTAEITYTKAYLGV